MPKLTVATYLTRAIQRSGKTVKQIAAETGFSASMLSSIKNGKEDLPLRRVVDLARALNVPADELMEITLRETQPAMWVIIEMSRKRVAQTLGHLTDNELEFLNIYRQATLNLDPPLTDAQLPALRELAETLMTEQKNS